MNTDRRTFLATAAAGLTATFASLPAQILGKAEPLPSWNEGAEKKSRLDFVAKTIARGATEFVEPSERIAVFDNDDTLWCRQSVSVQVFFVLNRVKALSARKPEMSHKEPFALLLVGDMKGGLAAGSTGIAELMAATRAGMTTDEVAHAVSAWIATANHPKPGRPFTEMVYQPMIEVLAHLRANESRGAIRTTLSQPTTGKAGS